MNENKRKAVNELATRLVEVLNLNYPINIQSVAESLGGEVSYIEGYIEDGLEAMIKKIDDSFQIVISTEKHYLRQRFSIAHELGHLFLHMGYLIKPDLWNKVRDYKDSVYYRHGYSKEEIEANEFAGALLMPEKKFREIANEYLNNGYYDVEKIAEFFEVSIPAATMRGKSLGLFG